MYFPRFIWVCDTTMLKIILNSFLERRPIGDMQCKAIISVEKCILPKTTDRNSFKE